VNSKVSQVMKFIACAGIVIGAPFVASFAVDATVAKIEYHMQIAACEKTAALDQITKECK
jgi:hypothetical protein